MNETPQNLPSLSEGDRKSVQLVWDRLEASARRFGGQARVWRELHRYYLSLSPTLRGRENDRPIARLDDDEPDLFVPKPFELIESAVPRWIFSLFGTRPYMKAAGRTEDDEAHASAAEMVNDYDFERANVLVRSVEGAKNLFKYGTLIWKTTWFHDSYTLKKKGYIGEEGEYGQVERPGKVERTIVRYNGPWLDIISPFNFFPDPLYYQFQQMRFCIEKRKTDLGTLKKENERYAKVTGKPLYKNLEKIPKLGRAVLERELEEDPADETAEVLGWRTGAAAMTGDWGTFLERDDSPVVVHEYWEADRKIFLANGLTIILDGENPFDDKEKPYGMLPCFPIEHEPWGLGLLHPIKKSIEELNSKRNLWMKQAQLNVLNIWGGDEGALAGLPGNIALLRPGTLIRMPFFQNGQSPLIPLLQGRPIPPEAYQMEDRIVNDIERATGLTGLVTSGMPSKGMDTATEAQLANEATSFRVRLSAVLGEAIYLTRLARQFYSRRQQFFSQEEVYRIAGKEGWEYKRLDREDIAGDFDWIPAGSQLSPNKEVLRQQILQALAVGAQNPAITPLMNWYEAWTFFWKTCDIRFPERFVVPPPEKVWEPDKENIILLAGEWVPVTQNEPHEEHVASHLQAFTQAKDERAREQTLRHIQEHRKFLKMKEQAPAPQELPGLRGYAGNVPNLENAPESMAGIQARTMGGPGV